MSDRHAKSFIGEMEDAARRFYATVLRGEVSDANVQGYLRAASQIADVWQQIDARIAEEMRQGIAPAAAYAKLGYALAFIRVARTYQVFVQQLLAADASFDLETEGFLPRVTYDQANALAHQIQPNLQMAVAALTDPDYQLEVALPLALGPRIEAEGVCPVTHLEGLIAAAREVREWAAGLIAEYAEAVERTTTASDSPASTSASASPAPATLTEHIAALNSRLAQADTQLRFGVDLVGQVTQGRVTPELHEQAETYLWQALGSYFLLNQAVALPDLLHESDVPAKSASARKPHVYHDLPIHPKELWRIAAPSARSELRGTEFGRDEMKEMCEKMGGILSAGAQQYQHEVENAVRRGDAISVGAMANCPFEPLYRARTALTLAGAQVPATYEFHWNYHRGHIESAPRFSRSNDWQECDE
ncbi:MAG TPA: hypothetical protein VF792_02090 [Ktedonobacterales bacterium]